MKTLSLKRHQPSRQMCSALLASVLLLSLAGQARPETAQQGAYYYGTLGPQHNNYYVQNAAAVKDPSLQKIYELIYPYYQRPRYRYPFYDHEGNGELLYGFGGRKLYRYTVFKPVEGYLRR